MNKIIGTLKEENTANLVRAETMLVSLRCR